MLSVGKILQKQRLNLNLTLKDIEKKLKVREKYLKALEEEKWNYFSSKIYIIGIIKNYSRLLGLNEEKMLAFFRRDFEKKEEIKFKEKVSAKYLTPETKKIITTIFVLLGLFFFSYFSYQFYLYFKPPSLTLISPTTDRFVRQDKITIIGKTNKDTIINIAGQRIYQDKNGVFKYDFPLTQKVNKLTIELIGANGKKSVIEKVFYNKLD
ncbi:MAG: helix-turn-helix domain-containing protein [Microgenomates group bacterium]